MTVVDINIHHLPEDLFTNEKILNGFLNSAPRGFGEIASVIEMEDGKKQLVLEKPKGYPNLNYVEGDYSTEAKLKAMDDAGVDYGIMRVPVWQEWLGLETCQAVNDNAAKIVAESNGRLFSTACVPPWGGKENIYELERCLDAGAVGVQLACHYGQLYLDDDAFKPYLKVLNEKKVPVIVHHTPLPVDWKSVIDYQNFRREYGRIMDQGIAVGRELFSGMFDEFPDLKFTHTMLGGNWFASTALLTPKPPKAGEAMQRLSTTGADKIKGYLENNIFFDLTHPHSWGKVQVEAALAINGADQAPFLRELLEFWDGLYREPFVGVTSDGVRREGLYALPADAVAEPAAAVAAQELLGTLTSGERDAICHDIDDPHWRAWSNPEFAVYRVGLRLEVLSEETYAAFDALLRASLSAQGYDRVTEAMALNGFLGEVTGLPTIMNARSYHFAIYGTPDPVEPWGWQIFGHHVVVNFVSVGGRHVIAPVFIGGEPALTEEHPPLFEERERLALELAGSLDEVQRAKCVVYESVLDPAMPEGRLHPADERHVGGAFRDNRVVAYEGICASDLGEDQLGLLREIVADSLGLLTAPQLELALAEYDNHLDETWFAWYGPTDGSGPCYYRVHSPVILAELDHHAGVWLSNRLPARFHVHTTLRHPNGNDYGKALIDQWSARQS